MQLPNGWLRLAMEMDEERKERLEKMVAIAQLLLALIKDVVNVGVFFVPQTHSEKFGNYAYHSNLMF